MLIQVKEKRTITKHSVTYSQTYFHKGQEAHMSASIENSSIGKFLTDQLYK